MSFHIKKQKQRLLLIATTFLVVFSGCAQQEQSNEQTYKIEPVVIIEEAKKEDAVLISSEYIEDTNNVLNNYYLVILNNKISNFFTLTNQRIFISFVQEENLKKITDDIFLKNNYSSDDLLIVISESNYSYDFKCGDNFIIEKDRINNLLTLAADYTINFYKQEAQYQYFLSLFIQSLKTEAEELTKSQIGKNIPTKIKYNYEVEPNILYVIEEATKIYNQSLYFSPVETTDEIFTAEIKSSPVKYKKFIFNEDFKNQDDIYRYLQNYFTTSYISNIFIDATNYITINNELCWEVEQHIGNQTFLYNDYIVKETTEDLVKIDIICYFVYNSDYNSYIKTGIGKMYSETYPIILKKIGNQWKIEHMIYWL